MTPPWSFPCRALCHDGVSHAIPTSTPSSSPTPVTPPQLRRALPSSSFIFGRRWAHHCVRLIVSFPFCRSLHVLRSSPSNFYIPSSLCSVAVTMASSVRAPCRPQSPTARQSHHGQQMRDAEPRPGNPTRWPPDLRSAAASWRPTSRPVPPPPVDSTTSARPYRWWAHIRDPLNLLFPFRASAEPLAAFSPRDDDAQEPPVCAFVGGFVHLKEEDEVAALHLDAWRIL
jgi:hypothetical protein